MKTQTLAENSVGQLVEVLRDELAAHHKLLHLEMAKRDAIMARNGDLLKQTSGEQAQELHRIDLLESRRDRLAQNIMHSDKDILLTDIIASDAVSAPEKTELSRYQNALKSALAELKKISEVNTRMLMDSRDLFKTMLSSLAGKSSNQPYTSRPIFVDANC